MRHHVIEGIQPRSWKWSAITVTTASCSCRAIAASGLAGNLAALEFERGTVALVGPHAEPVSWWGF
jgi:hypothetical protein